MGTSPGTLGRWPALAVATAVLAAGAGAAGVVATTLRRSTAASDVPAPPVLPIRTSSPAVTAPPSPPLPSEAETIPPLAFTVVTTAKRGATQEVTRMHVVRTVDRIQLTLDKGRREWLFERNPLDYRRVSGYQTDHAVRRVLAYQESDLRTDQRLRGWADVLTMRFDPAVLTTLRATGKYADAAGTRFRQFLARERRAQGVLEVWWSETLLLPIRVISRHGDVVTTSVVQRLKPADTVDLADPRQRFPSYVAMDVTDTRDHRH